MADKTPMTSKSYALLQEELTRLKGVERRKASDAIAEARAHGDLSENAEYDAAKEHQGMLEARIRLLESRLATAQVIDISKLSGDKIVFGATVEVCDIDSGEEKTVTIVGEDEADAAHGLISYLSPLARALIGRTQDDVVKLKLPAGEREYEIRAVKFVADLESGTAA